MGRKGQTDMTEFEYWAARINEQMEEIIAELDTVIENLREAERASEQLELYIQDTEYTAEQ